MKFRVLKSLFFSEKRGVIFFWLLLFSGISFHSNAQRVATKMIYDKLGSDITGIELIPSNDGGYYFSAVTGSPGQDVLIFKLTNQLNVIWAKKFGTIGSSDNPMQIVVDKSSNLYFLMWTSEADGNHSSSLIKINSKGEQVWGRKLKLDGNGTHHTNMTALSFSKDSLLRMTGGIFGGPGVYDALLLNINMSGNFIDDNLYYTNEYDEFSSVNPTSDGGMITTSRTDLNRIIADPTFADMVVIKMNKDNEIEWSKLLKGAGTTESFPGFNENSVMEYEEGYLFVGVSKELRGNKDILIVSLDWNGNVKWSKLYGGSKNDAFPTKSFVNNGDGFSICVKYDDKGLNIPLLLEIDYDGHLKRANRVIAPDQKTVVNFYRPHVVGNELVAVLRVIDEFDSAYSTVIIRSNRFSYSDCYFENFADSITVTDVTEMISSVDYTEFSLLKGGTMLSLLNDNSISFELQIEDTTLCTFSNVRMNMQDHSVCAGQTVVIEANGDEMYSWFKLPELEFISSGNSLSFFIEETTSFLLAGNNGGLDTIQIRVLPNEECLEPLPDQFAYGFVTPNNDGVNDVFYIENMKSELKESTLKIYDKWGQLVANEKNYKNDWPNQDQSIGEYFYVFINPSGEVVKKGRILVK